MVLSDITVLAMGALTSGPRRIAEGITPSSMSRPEPTPCLRRAAPRLRTGRTILDAQGDVAVWISRHSCLCCRAITSGGLSLSNVTVVIGSRSGLSDSNGNYTVSRLRDNTYEVRPMLAGYAFAPTNGTVTVGPSTNNVNFAASGVLTISGRVLEGSAGVSNILITARTNAGAVLTDASGNYALSNLTPRTFLLSAQPWVRFSPSISQSFSAARMPPHQLHGQTRSPRHRPVTNAMRITGLGCPSTITGARFAAASPPTNGCRCHAQRFDQRHVRYIDVISNSPISFTTACLSKRRSNKTSPGLRIPAGSSA
jgi:hypothetical protein